MDKLQQCQNQAPIQQSSEVKGDLIVSQYISKYEQQMVETQQIIQRQQLQKLKQHKIKYDINKKYHKFDCFIKSHHQDFIILNMQISIGCFQLQASILNKNINNPFMNVFQSIVNKQGHIFLLELRNKKIAIKSFVYGGIENDEQNLNNFHNIFQLALKQWTIHKVASALQCSSKIQNYLGFDIIVYSDSIIFAMEQCDKIEYLSKADLYCLKNQLKVLHKFKIIHFDIKPQNIMISPSLKRKVFIDFGLSQNIEQSFGYKSLMDYRGTTQYSSDQMLELLHLKQKKYIDVYYNDLHCLQNTYKVSAQNNCNYNYYCQKLQINSQQDKTLQIIVQQQEKQILMNKNNQRVKFELILQIFKYYYLKQDTINVRQLLQQNYLNFKFIKASDILQFINQNFLAHFLKITFEQDLFYLHKHEIYHIIKERYIHLNQKILKNNTANFDQKQLHHHEDQLYGKDLQQKYQVYLPKAEYFYNNTPYEELYIKIKSLQFAKLISIGDQSILIIFHKCLRFDLQNLQIQKKVQISIILRRMNGQILQQNYKGSPQDIKYALKLLLQYSLKQPCNSLKKTLSLQLFIQNILIDNNILDQMVFFSQKWLSRYEGLDQKTLAYAQLHLMMKLLLITAITEENKHYSIPTYETIQKDLKVMYKKINNIQYCKNEQERTIKQILKLFKQNYIVQQHQFILNLQTIQNYLPFINNNKIRYRLEFMNITYSIYSEHFSVNHNIISKIKNIFFKKCYEDNILTYFALEFWMICLETNNEQQIIYIPQIIRKKINYEPIFKKLICNHFNTIYENNVNNEEYLKKYLTSLQLNIKGKFYYNNFLKAININKIIDFIVQNIKICLSAQTKQMLTKIVYCFQTLQYQQQSIERQQGFLRLTTYKDHISKIINLLSIETNMMRIIPELHIQRQQKLTNLKLKEQIYKKKERSAADYINLLLINFQINLRQIYLCYHKKNILDNEKQKILSFLNSIKLLNFPLITFIIHFIAFQIFHEKKDFLMISIILEQIYSYLIQHKHIYEFLRQNWYSKVFIYNLVDHYYRKQQLDKVQIIFRVIFQWLVANQLENYSMKIITSMQLIHGYHSEMFENSRFNYKIINTTQNQSPYFIIYYIYIVIHQQPSRQRSILLLKIAKRLNQVNKSTKDFVLDLYYRTCIELQNFKQRKIRNLAYFSASHYLPKETKLYFFNKIKKKFKLKSQVRNKMIFQTVQLKFKSWVQNQYKKQPIKRRQKLETQT